MGIESRPCLHSDSASLVGQWRRISGWGNLRTARSLVMTPTDDGELRLATRTEEHSVIARGLGRSYGDSATNEGGAVVDMTARRRLLWLDEEQGIIRAQGGLSFADLHAAVMPRGYFAPVTPGSQFVTMGGALAADVHGKNHHVDGGFSEFVREVTLCLPTGERVTTRPGEELFWATVGGMGLTGFIDEVTLQLLPIESARVRVSATRTRNLEETLAELERTAAAHRYSVSWIDALAEGKSLGRGWVLAGEHGKRDELPLEWRAEPLAMEKKWRLTVPAFLPSFVLSRPSCGWFNEWMYRRGIVKGEWVDAEEFFYPLDSVRHWNRIYGRRGFAQYQGLFPFEAGARGLVEFLETIVRSGVPACFAGIKSAGKASGGMLSFLHPGFTIGVDFPNRPGLEGLARRLDEVVLRHGGRVYLAKDAFLNEETFRRMYPRVSEFEEVRRRVDPEGKLASDQARRIGLAK